MQRVERQQFGEAVERFEYLEPPDAPFVPAWTGWEDVESGAGVPGELRPGRREPGEAACEEEREEERRRAFEVGLGRGREEGRRAEREAQAERWRQAEEKRAGEAAAWLEQFGRERERYFRAVEPEVVRLALAVSARILRREAASDPLLLMGAVRAALGQIAGAAEVRLRVPAADLDLWSQAVALLPHAALRPALVAGEGMRLGQCVLETDLGSADLGLSTQLAEIERVLLGGEAAGAATSEERKLASAGSAG